VTSARGARLFAALIALGLAAGGGLWAEPEKVAEGFRTEGSLYVSTASGTGASAREAEERARSAALRGLFAGLSKDRLFAEVFTASPPLGLSFQLADSSKSGASYKALVSLKIDDESLRIIERGPYLAAALALLDKAEASSDEAEGRRAQAASAEAAADLGAALGLYGMSAEACRSALELVDPLADPSIFSQKGKRTAIELKKSLSSCLVEATAGIERVEKAQAALAADASSEAAEAVADSAVAAADATEALLAEEAPVLDDLGAYDAERLSSLRDRIDMQRRAVSDSLAALDRAKASIPEGSTFANDKVEFARRRLATAADSLSGAYGRVDREIRDPAARRAARAQAIRWALLHLPREYASLRVYLPFNLAAREGGLGPSPFSARAGFEGAFPLGQGGVWVRSEAGYAKRDLEPGEAGGDEVSLIQSFDFGVWGKRLIFAGYRWDWLRHVDSESIPKAGALELGIGGVFPHGKSEERFHRADWTLALSYEFPDSFSDASFWALVNAGLEARFRLGDIALLEASLAQRLDGESDSLYVSTLSWAIALGFRLPAPFAFGAEYGGSFVRPLMGDESLGDAYAFDGGRFRFFLQYSL
jgi:hypothetical protein